MQIKNAKVFTENNRFEEVDLRISDGRITELIPRAQTGERKYAAPGETGFAEAEEEVIDAEGLLAIPGLVDIHFHGALGHDFCDADVNGLAKIAEYEASRGVLAICPATMTYSEEILNEVVDAAKEYAKKPSSAGADFVGINMEGPFISPDKLGAQNPTYLHKPDVEMFERLQERSGGLFKLVDLAPEVDGAMEFIRQCSEEVKISIAHTATDYETALEAFEMGASHLTHLYNAMPDMTHRNPGPIVAGIEQGAEAELIADGIHSHPAMVRLAFRNFGPDKMILISDSMEATGLPDGQYQLGGQPVTKVGNLATLTEQGNVIAGSVTDLMGCMKTAVQQMGIPLEEAVRAATINPARSIGIDKDYGSIAPGKPAKIVLLDENLEIVQILK